jgi:signal transduction histidine kinase
VECGRLKDLIRGLHDFYRPSSGSTVWLDIHTMLDSIVLLHKSDFNDKRITVVRNYAQQLPQIQGVADQLKQVFLNLLSNAADACIQPGGVITISTWQQDEKVAVAINDTGIGIRAENIDKVFEPFFTTKHETKGTGLGLSVCHGIIQSHQGEIRIECGQSGGATFTVLLPIHGGACPSVGDSADAWLHLERGGD